MSIVKSKESQKNLFTFLEGPMNEFIFLDDYSKE